MKRGKLVLAAVLAALIAGAPGVTAGEAAALVGVVKDHDGKPLAGVIVRAMSLRQETKHRSVQTTTGKDGRYRIEGAEPGENAVTVQSLLPGDNFAVDAGKVTLGEKEVKLDIRLAKTEITGKLTLADTKKPPEPRAGASLSLYHLVRADRGGETIAGSAGMAFPDEDGHYRFRGFPPGRYRIYANLRGYRRVEKDVEVKKGKKLSGIDIVLAPLEPGTIRVTVKDAEGKPVENVRFSYDSGGGITSSLRAETPEPGVYVIDQLEAGTWTIFAYRADLKPAHAKVKVVKGETVDVEITMEPK